MATSCHSDRRQLLIWMAAAATTTPMQLFAQDSASPIAAMAELSGTTSSGQRITLQRLRGQVVLIFYWSTECAVCRNKMPELRANASGWIGQNFMLIGVNMDEKKENFLRYEKVVTPLLPPEQQFASVWGRDPTYLDNLGPAQHLPSTVLVDKTGRVAERYNGRIPPQAWNRIADLL